MNEKYSVGDKVITADTWNNGQGLVIPVGSVVEIVRAYTYDGVNMYYCLYNDERIIYEEQWLGEVQAKIGEWIPCSERLPECGAGMFLACAENGYIFMAVRSHDGDFREMYTIGLEGFSEDNPIVAWQPLPAPYEVESDE